MSGDGGFGRDSGTPKRRMLPAVTDVVRELARTASADPAVLFKAARSVVADELAKVKQGFESAPLDVLVRRARRQLEQEGVVPPIAEGAPEEPRSVSIPTAPLKPKKAAGAPGEDPFQSAGAADLEWEKRLDLQPDDAPFRSAILPLPPRSRAPVGIAPPEETDVPAPPAPAPAPPPSFSRLPVPDRVVAPEGLATERSGSGPRPKRPVDDLPLFSSSTLELSSPLAPAPPPAAPEPPPRAEPPAPEPQAFGESPAFAAPEPTPPPHVEEPGEADLERPDPWVHSTEEPAFEAPRERFVAPAPRFETPPPPPRFEPSFRDLEPPAPRLEPPVRSMSEMPPLAHLVGDVTEPVEPAMEEFAFKGAETAAPARRSGAAGWVAAIAVVLAVAAGLLWAVRTFLSGDVVKRVDAPAPASVPKKREAATVPAPAAPAPAPVAAAPAPAKAAPPAKPAPAAASVAKGKAAPLVTPDWTGKPVVYVVHFSSHKDRPSADKEAKRLAGALGRPGRAVEVDLGAKGVWYRVVLGEFATVEEARAWRAELEAKKTPDLGFVYEMRGR